MRAWSRVRANVEQLRMTEMTEMSYILMGALSYPMFANLLASLDPDWLGAVLHC